MAKGSFIKDAVTRMMNTKILADQGWDEDFLDVHPLAVPCITRCDIPAPGPGQELPWLSRCLSGPESPAVMSALLRGPGDASNSWRPDYVPEFSAVTQMFFAEARRLVTDVAHAERIGQLTALHAVVFGTAKTPRGAAVLPLVFADPEGFAAFAEAWPVDYLFDPAFVTVDRLYNAAARETVSSFADLERWYRTVVAETVADVGVQFLDNDDHAEVPVPGTSGALVRLRSPDEFAAAFPPLQASPFRAGDLFHEAAFEHGAGPSGPFYVYHMDLGPDAAGSTFVMADPFYRASTHSAGLEARQVREREGLAETALQAVADERRPLITLDD